MIKNPIARITAAIIVIFSLMGAVGIFGDLPDNGTRILDFMIGAAITFLFVAQTKAASNTG